VSETLRLHSPDAVLHALADLEALLFAAGRPLALAEIARRLALGEPEARALLARMDDELARPGRGLQLRETAGKWRLETRADREEIVSALRVERGERPLSAQALETLAAVALRQPVSTEEVTAIRGAESYATLETLRRRRLIARVDPEPGRAGRWRTTRYFLELFGLRHPAEIAQSDRMAGVFPEQR
jgi:segregation and condensation protein B